MLISAPLNHHPNPALQKIEVASSLQIPNFYIIGLPNPEIEEARERIRAAIGAAGLEFPRRRVVLNLSPASIRKRGTGLDLPMALAVLNSSREAPSGLSDRAKDKSLHIVAWGELGLDGTLSAAGQCTRAVYSCWQASADFLLVSLADYPGCARALAQIRKSRIFSPEPPALIPCGDLEQAWETFQQILNNPEAMKSRVQPPKHEAPKCGGTRRSVHLLRLSPSLHRTLVVAAAGNHHLLLLGSRGSGKSHAIEWLVALQPEVSVSVQLQNQLVAELGPDRSSHSDSAQDDAAPIRRISVQARPEALIGGASPSGVYPGEFCKAHGGILIADEFLEWARDSREALREPLESGRISITRAQAVAELPAGFTLAATGNLCPCGGWPPGLPLPPRISAPGMRHLRCKCTPHARTAYLGRLSGPILDRLDLVLLVYPSSTSLDERDAADEAVVESARMEVRKAREFGIVTRGRPAGNLDGAELEAELRDNEDWRAWSRRQLPGSLRSRHKVARIALTLAALEGKVRPETAHFIEAAGYRPEALALFS